MLAGGWYMCMYTVCTWVGVYMLVCVYMCVHVHMGERALPCTVWLARAVAPGS